MAQRSSIRIIQLCSYISISSRCSFLHPVCHIFGLFAICSHLQKLEKWHSFIWKISDLYLAIWEGKKVKGHNQDNNLTAATCIHLHIQIMICIYILFSHLPVLFSRNICTKLKVQRSMCIKWLLVAAIHLWVCDLYLQPSHHSSYHFVCVSDLWWHKGQRSNVNSWRWICCGRLFQS